MNQDDFQKTGYCLCRKCGTRNPLTAYRCQNYNCGADLLLYGDTIGPSPEPDNPEPVSPGGSGGGAGKNTGNNSGMNNSGGGTNGAGGNTGGAGGMNSHGSGAGSTGGSAGKTGGNSTKDENDPSGKSGRKKKKRGKRLIIKILIALLCVWALAAVLIFVRYEVGGSAGDNVHWSINLLSGEMTISGSGDMDDYSYTSSSKRPWVFEHVNASVVLDNIQTVVIEDGVTSIGDYAFASCHNLTSIAIPDSVTSIGDSAFRFCDSLTSITIPDRVTSIGDYAFRFCDSLTDVYYAGSESAWAAIEIGSDNDSLLNAEIHYGTEDLPDDIVLGMDTGCGILLETFEYEGAVYGLTDEELYALLYVYPETETVDIPDTIDGYYVVWIYAGAMESVDSLTELVLGEMTCYDYSLNTWLNTYVSTIRYTSGSLAQSWMITCDIADALNESRASNDEIIPDLLTAMAAKIRAQELAESYTVERPDGSNSSTALDECGVAYTSYGSSGGYCALDDDLGYWDLYDDVEALLEEYETEVSSLAEYENIGIGLCYDTDCVYVYAFFTSEETSTDVGSGSSNSSGNLTWALEDGVLTISGSGDMTDYEDDEDAPWYETRYSIQTVITEDGMTSIGDFAFNDCYSLTSITVPDGARSITNPKSVTSIENYAFDSCDSLADVYYTGSESDWAAIEILSSNDSLLNAEIHYGTEEQSDGSLTWTLEDGVLTISGSGDMTDFEEVEEDMPWYEMRNSIQTVVIENGVTSIGDRAFCFCESLTSITIPDSVTSIGDCAFASCDSLTSIAIPDGVTSIGVDAFQSCKSLISITIPDSVTSIGRWAFRSCDNLTDVYYAGTESAWAAIEIDSDNDSLLNAEIHYGTEEQSDGSLTWTLEDGVLTISGSGDMTDFEDEWHVPWYEMRDSIQTVVIEYGVTSIGNYAFASCQNLTSLAISDSVTSIGDQAFPFCESLTSITIPESVTNIGYSAFCYCTSLTSITIPDGVTSIGEEAFKHCDSLISITIPDSVTSIGFWTFAHCDSLTSVTIPNSVTSIGSGAFYSCDSLADVYYAGTESDWAAIEILSSNDSLMNAEIHYGTEGQSGGSLTWTLEDGVLTISGSGDMMDCEDEEDIPWYEMRYSIQTVVIENGVTSIGDSTFSDCYSLKSITIPESVTSIGVSAFYDCYNLTSITIPDGVTSLGNFTFNGCYNLTSITIPDSVTSIGDCAFDSCYSLTDVYYAGSESDWAAIEIGSSNDDLLDAEIHYGTEEQSGGSLTWTLENGVLLTISGSGDMTDYEDDEDVPWYEMRDSIQTVVIEDGVTSIGNRAFWRCDSLTSITIPESVTSIGDYAFYSCDSLTSITIPESVTNIGHSVFEFCYNLTSITIPDSVMSIGRWAFDFCDSLTDVYYAGTESAWAAIEIGSDNDSLLNAEIHYGS